MEMGDTIPQKQKATWNGMILVSHSIQPVNVKTPRNKDNSTFTNENESKTTMRQP